MSLASRVEEEFDLDKLDAEIKMEKIRQTAAKLSWDSFGHALRKGLMEKRLIFDANERIDVLNALSILRKGLPVDEKSDLTTKLRQLSDSLECQFSVQPGAICMKNIDVCIEVVVDGSEVKSCSVGYFSQPVVQCPELKSLIEGEEWEKIRCGVHSVLMSVPQCNNPADRAALANSLATFEQWLSVQNERILTSWSINGLPCGALVARTQLRPSRLYYMVTPNHLTLTGKEESERVENFDGLPYLELSVTPCERETTMPVVINGVEWVTTRPSKGCFTLRFSTPMIFSATTWRHMHQYMAKPSTVRQHVNIYRYLSGFDVREPSLILRSCFRGGEVQHVYEMDGSELEEERDVIVGEIHVNNGMLLNEVLKLIRAQAQHNYIFETILSVCSRRARGKRAVKIRTSASARAFELAFVHAGQLFVVRIFLENNGWVTRIEDTEGQVIFGGTGGLNDEVTEIMQNFLSIPLTLSQIFSAMSVDGEPVEKPIRTDNKKGNGLIFTSNGVHKKENLLPNKTETDPMEMDDNHDDNDDDDVDMKPELNDLSSVVDDKHKIGSAWLPRTNSHNNTHHRSGKKQKKGAFIFQIDHPELPCGGKPAGLLSMFKEIEEVHQELIPPLGARGGRDRDSQEDMLAVRSTHRTLSDNTLAKTAFSDLEAICRMAESVDDESRGSPTVNLNKDSPIGGMNRGYTPQHQQQQMGGMQTPGYGNVPGGGGGPMGGHTPSYMMGGGGGTPTAPSPMTPMSQHQQQQYQQQQPPQGVHRAPPTPSGIGGGMGTQSLSPLESARQKMTMAVNNTDVFDFPDERSNSSTGSFPSPVGSAPYGYTHFPGGPSASPLGASAAAAALRGQVTKRRGRGRKTGNMGERLPDGSVGAVLAAAGAAEKKTRGGTGVRRPRGPRKTATSIEHLPYDQRPLLQRSFSDAQYTQSPNPLSNTSSNEQRSMDSPYVESESDDGETDPPPPPKILAHHQQMPHPHHSGMPGPSTIIPATVPPSPAALAAAAAMGASNSPAHGPSSASPAYRKNSLDFSSGKPGGKTSVSGAPASNKKGGGMLDLYDDGTDSPPPPGLSPITQFKEKPGSSQNQSPFPTYPSPSHSDSASNPAGGPPSLKEITRAGSSTPTGASNAPGGSMKESKLILKIPKTTPRSSPSVDTMKSKSSTTPGGTGPKPSASEKAEKKEKKEKSSFAGPKSAKIAFEERRKRKLEGGEKVKKEHKKAKMAEKEKVDASLPPVLPPFGLGNFKNFKIPKKDTIESEPSSSTTPTTPITTAPPGPRPGAEREIEREKERHRERERERDTASGGGGGSGRKLSKSILKHGVAPVIIPTVGPSPSGPPSASRIGPAVPPVLSNPINIPLPSGPPPPPLVGVGPPGLLTNPPVPAGVRKPLLPPPDRRLSLGAPLGAPPPPGGLRGMPPSLLKGPPTASRWVPPPHSSVTHPSTIPSTPRSPSPDPEAMQIDDALSPDALRIADD